MFETYLLRWNLVPDGDPITTPAARLLPVLHGDQLAVLKLSHEEDERRGGTLMQWWDGEGSARVFARDDTALLLERATGSASLAKMARDGRDDDACRILCATAARLHAPRSKPFPELIPLAHWFRELEPAAAKYGGILLRCAESARLLLAEPGECGVLHGDIHHGNVLDFGARGWLAIDPKGWLGERGFEFAKFLPTPIWLIRLALSRPSPAVSHDAWRSLPKPRSSNGSAWCAGFSPGPDCRRHGPSATMIRRQRSLYGLPSWLPLNSITDPQGRNGTDR